MSCPWNYNSYDSNSYFCTLYYVRLWSFLAFPHSLFHCIIARPLFINGKGQPLIKLIVKLAPANMNIKYFALILLTSYLHHKCIQLEVWQTLILHCNNWISLMLEFHLHCWITIVMKVKSITDQSCNEDLWRFWLFLDRIDSNDMSLTAIPLL